MHRKVPFFWCLQAEKMFVKGSPWEKTLILSEQKRKKKRKLGSLKTREFPRVVNMVYSRGQEVPDPLSIGPLDSQRVWVGGHCAQSYTKSYQESNIPFDKKCAQGNQVLPYRTLPDFPTLKKTVSINIFEKENLTFFPLNYSISQQKRNTCFRQFLKRFGFENNTAVTIVSLVIFLS